MTALHAANESATEWFARAATRSPYAITCGCRKQNIITEHKKLREQKGNACGDGHAVAPCSTFMVPPGELWYGTYLVPGTAYFPCGTYLGFTAPQLRG